MKRVVPALISMLSAAALALSAQSVPAGNGVEAWDSLGGLHIRKLHAGGLPRPSELACHPQTPSSTPEV